MKNGDTVRVKWLRTAKSNLDEEIEYIAQEDKETAAKIYEYIRQRVSALEQNPDVGRPGRVFGTRELVINRYPYIVPYRVREDAVEILRLFHTSRKSPEK